MADYNDPFEQVGEIPVFDLNRADECADSGCPSCDRDLTYPDKPGHVCYTYADQARWRADSELIEERPLGHVVREISAGIDSTYPTGLDREAHLLRRVMKVSEETGEVTEALFGALGENARKGRTHTMDDVRRELLDVALAALAAIAHFDDDDPIDYLDAHARSVYARLLAVVTPPGGAS